MAIFVQTSDDEPPAHAPCVFSRDQYEACARINRLNRDKAIDAGHAERGVLHLDELFEHLMIEGELVDVVDTVWEEAEQTVGLVAGVLVE